MGVQKTESLPMPFSVLASTSLRRPTRPLCGDADVQFDHGLHERVLVGSVAGDLRRQGHRLRRGVVRQIEVVDGEGDVGLPFGEGDRRGDSGSRKIRGFHPELNRREEAQVGSARTFRFEGQGDEPDILNVPGATP